MEDVVEALHPGKLSHRRDARPPPHKRCCRKSSSNCPLNEETLGLLHRVEVVEGGEPEQHQTGEEHNPLTVEVMEDEGEENHRVELVKKVLKEEKTPPEKTDEKVTEEDEEDVLLTGGT